MYYTVVAAALLRIGQSMRRLWSSSLRRERACCSFAAGESGPAKSVDGEATTGTRSRHLEHDFSGFPLADPSDSLPDEVLLCLSRGALSVFGVRKGSDDLTPEQAWVASDVSKVCAAGHSENMDVITVELKSSNMLYSFEVDCGDAVVDAWNRLNPKSSRTSVSQSLANVRVLI